MIELGWDDIDLAVKALCARNEPRPYVYGPPMGGYPVAIQVANEWASEVYVGPLDDLPPADVLVVDDLVDSGRTLAKIAAQGYEVDALYRKPHSPPVAPFASLRDGWLVFPWEHATGPEDAVVRLLEHIGEDPTRDGLIDTPRRVVNAWSEMTSGYRVDPATVLGTTFDVPYDEVVILRDIPFASNCEHHLLPFTGTASIAYIPVDRVVGISKLARLVDVFARRLQVQERMTRQVAETIRDALEPLGVAVVVHGWHSCMSSRGVGKLAPMVTSCMLGEFKEKPAARAEVLSLLR